MPSDRFRVVLAVVGRYGVLSPGVAAAGAYAASTRLASSFGTVLFYVFAVGVVLTGFGALSSSPSTVPGAAGDVGASVGPAERWNDALVVKLVLFDLGLAAVLAALTVAGTPST
ncbi:MAG: hypothetical protein ABEJ88_07235 [Halobacterium sp.]